MDNSQIMLKNYRLMESGINDIDTDINTTFTHIRVFSDTDLNLFNRINLSVGGNFEFFGSIYSYIFKSTMLNFFESLGNDKKISKSVCKILISKVVIPFLVANHVDCLWMKINGMFPTPNYTIPRWHCDGPFYKTTNSYQLKLAGALIGPGTLFKKTISTDVDNFMAEYRKLYSGFKLDDYDREADIVNRKILDDHYKHIPTIQLKNSDISIFTVGRIPKVAIHSEPNINTKRLFFSIVAGTADNIQELAKNWNKVFVKK